jgi:ATP-dependent DNA helicase RecG
MSPQAPVDALSPLARPVTVLAGVGPERAAQLARVDIHTVEDLLLHRPRRYEDRRRFVSVAQLRQNEAATTRGSVVALGVKWYNRRQKSIFELILDDGTGRLHCRWWNLPFMEKYFSVGDEVVVYGKLLVLKPRTIDHPETEILSGEESFIHLNRITPIYPLTEGLTQRWLRALVWRTLASCEPHLDEPWRVEATPVRCPPFTRLLSNAPGEGTGPTRVSAPEGIRVGRVPPRGVPAALPTPEPAEANSEPPNAVLGAGLPGLTRRQAIHSLHFPEAEAEIEAARRRLALDEFVDLQRQIRLRRRNFETKARALACPGDNRLIKPFLHALNFKLTGAQTAVLRDLRHDLAGEHPMRRLLQGDVGSGKTVVAACCALLAIESGYAAALMAPTEVLAAQHFHTFSNWFGPLGIPVQINTGSWKGQGAGPASAALGSPPADAEHKSGGQPVLPALTIGTHALLADGLALPGLGLVIIDEQQKFGVAQREQLVRKGRYPHLLVMTATPIPRTLALTLYGELDVSTINELPPGRGSVKTFVRTGDKLPKVWEFVRARLAEGRQAYVVYPRVEDAGQSGVKAVLKEFDRVCQVLSPFRAGLLHGRLKAKAKEEVMEAFRANQVQALLATSLIEVGLDVANATIMLVENAERFGLAQLHQLRGRIGRGARESYCILVAGAATPEARERLKVLEETTDGFRIAEADLRLRGPGQLLGQQQSGAPRFRFADFATDADLIAPAREIAAQLVGDAPALD